MLLVLAQQFIDVKIKLTILFAFPFQFYTTVFSFKAGQKEECQQTSICVSQAKSLASSPQKNISLKPQPSAVFSLYVRQCNPTDLP